MPVGLIIFGDKSHTDLHGALSLTPIIFTLTMFSRTSRNNTNFWRPLSYIPNLGYGKNKADKTETRNKIQDEHTCLSVIFESVREIHRRVGFWPQSWEERCYHQGIDSLLHWGYQGK
jgi:hypothetical protein